MIEIANSLEKIAELSNEELSSLKESIVSEYSAIKESEPTREVVEQMQELASAAQAVVGETQRREAEAAELAAAAEEAGASISALEAPAEAEAEVEAEEAATANEAADSDEEEDLAEDEEIDPVTGKKRKKKGAEPAEDVTEASLNDITESVEAPAEEVSEVQEFALEPSEGSPEALKADGEPAKMAPSAKEEAAEVVEETEVPEVTEETPVEAEPVVAEEVAVEAEAEEVPAESTEDDAESTDIEETEKDSEDTVTASASNDENLVVEVPDDHKPQPKVEKAPVTITAGADVPGVTAGSPLPDMRSVAQAIIDRRKGMGRTSGGDGEQHTVATFSTSYPESRILDGNDVDSNEEKIKAVVSAEALVAAGGLLGPVETTYDLFGLEENLGRPVRDSLAVFNADRGGVRFLSSPVLEDLEGAASVWTLADDYAAADDEGENPYGATSAGYTGTKPCIRIKAATPTEVFVDAIPLCLTFGNMGARFFPELVERHTRLGMMYHARYAEQRLITKIGTLSTSVTTEAELGAARDILVAIETAAAGYRNRHRMDANSPLRVIFPEWFKNALRADLTKQIPGSDADDAINLSEARLNAWFSTRGINVTWTPDGESTQYFSAQEAGALNSFPDNVVWYLFSEGTFLFLDGGTLDLGLVRDSTLNGTNDYKIFLETFEGVAKVGVESLRVTTPVRLYGATAATVDTVGADASDGEEG